MPIPGKRRSRSKKRRGWAHRALVKMTLTACPSCSKLTFQHQACAFCGVYRGRKYGKAKIALRGKKGTAKSSEKKAPETEHASAHHHS